MSMIFRKILSITAAASLAVFAVTSCDVLSDDDVESTTNYITQEGYTPLYIGTGSVLGETVDSLILYSTPNPDEYDIPKFFGGYGDLPFKWDKETNSIEMEECWTGIWDVNPVYVVKQSTYDSYMGAEKKASFYEPNSKIFIFNVVLSTMDANYNTYMTPYTFSYEVKGPAPTSSSN